MLFREWSQWVILLPVFVFELLFSIVEILNSERVDAAVLVHLDHELLSGGVALKVIHHFKSFSGIVLGALHCILTLLHLKSAALI